MRVLGAGNLGHWKLAKKANHVNQPAWGIQKTSPFVKIILAGKSPTEKRNANEYTG
jgi:hypothetical protein